MVRDARTNAIDDELSWAEQVQDETQETVVRAVASSRVARALLRNPQYVAAAQSVTGFITPAQRDAIRAEYNLPRLLVHDGKVGGVRTTPDDSIALVTASVGEFQWGDTVEGLIKRADIALYEAKTAGRNRVVSATTDLVLDRAG